jgi:uncharacterized protein YoxC
MKRTLREVFLSADISSKSLDQLRREIDSIESKKEDLTRKYNEQIADLNRHQANLQSRFEILNRKNKDYQAK